MVRFHKWNVYSRAPVTRAVRRTEMKRLTESETESLRSQYPATPFVILSGLAEGAERLVARIAMEEMDAALVAVLPMPPDDYEGDFESDASKAQKSRRRSSGWTH